MKRIISFAYITFLLFLSGSVSAQVNCGNTITTNTILTSDLLNCPNHGIVIGSDNIILDCNGHILTGSGNDYGIYLGKSGVTIKNCNINNFRLGIAAVHVSNNTLLNNTASSNKQNGIELYNTNHSTLTDNTLISNQGRGIKLESAKNSILANNTLISNYDEGIWLVYSDNNSLKNNKVNFNKNGIYLSRSNNNVIMDNNVSSSAGFNIQLSNSNYNDIKFNDFLNGGIGIQLSNSINNNATNNTVSDNDDGIYLVYFSDNNTISNNTVSRGHYGIQLLYFSFNNLVYHNNIIDNIDQARDTSKAKNNWYHPTLLEGNYWSDYIGVDDGSSIGKHSIAGDGIGDTLVSHPSEGYDYYPLTFAPSEPSLEAIIQEFNITIQELNASVQILKEELEEKNQAIDMLNATAQEQETKIGLIDSTLNTLKDFVKKIYDALPAGWKNKIGDWPF